MTASVSGLLAQPVDELVGNDAAPLRERSKAKFGLGFRSDFGRLPTTVGQRPAQQIRTTAPAGFDSRAATSFTAMSTSSSMFSVVRMADSIMDASRR